MNNNSANGQNTSRKLLSVSKASPCLHCGKPDWCYSIGELTACKRPQYPPAAGWEVTSKTDKDGTPFYAPIREKKAIRPRQTRYWEYPARDGSLLVRVVRFDDGKGGGGGSSKKPAWHQERWNISKIKNKNGWVPGIEGIDRADIPIYRYAEVKKAIANNELIFIPEGEDNVDKFWALGFAATCNIGGSGKWRDSDTRDLEGAKVVIVPDRDEPGINHAEGVHQHFPGALWLYPFPNSKAWQNLPKSKGLDIADWIEQHQITADDIKAVIGEKKVFTAPQAAAKVVTDDRFKLSSVDLRQEITALVNAGTTGSELTAALLELSRGSNAQQVERIYKEILEEADREEQRFDRKADIEKLQEISGRKLTLEKYLHPSLAEPIKKVSAWMGVDPEAVLTHLLPISAGLINPNSRVVAKRCINFVEPLLIYSGVVALTGSRKSPLLDIVKSPLVKLQTEEEERDSIAWKVYQDELRSFNESKDKDKGDPPKEPPPPREFYVDNITVESLDKIKGQQPNHALTLIKDELSGLFASHGQYKGGKGSDKESFLSGWNGKGIKKNRCSKDSRVSLARDSLSVTGGIQPDKLRALLGDFRDAQGEWARFLWYHMPMRPYKIPRDDTSYSLGDLLEATYRKLNSLPALEFSFDKDGQNFFDDWHDRKDEQKRKETRLGLQAAIAKMPGQAVRIIGLLHVLNGVSSESASVQTKIPLATVRAGCHLAEFYLGQVTLLQRDGDALNGEITPVLKKLLDKVGEVGSLTARQAIAGLRDLGKKKAEQVRELFTELAAMGLANLQGIGSRLTLISKVLTTADKNQKNQNDDSTRLVGDIDSKVLTTADEVLTHSQEAKSTIEQGVQEINSQSADSADRLEDVKTDFPSSKVESGDDAPLSSADTNSSFEETVSTSALNAESLVQQDNISTDDLSAVCQHLSAVDDSSAVITPEDAEKLRDLALIWWPEYYPDQLQNLLTQMYAWNAPGAKYDVAVIAKWLESQDELIRDRITELVNQKKASLDR
jgi:CRISPR-associated protein Cmr3